MADPIITSASLNKTNFNAGEAGTVTVSYQDADNFTENRNLTITVTDEDGGTSATVALPFTVKHIDQLTLEFEDSDSSKVWALVSNNAGTAIASCPSV